MRAEENSLDLNNYPDEHGKPPPPVEESSMTSAASVGTTRFKKKKGLGKDEPAKVYECRFCSLKFCKSQALGGHMNRHRQERETETLDRARQLVFSTEGLAGAASAIGLKVAHGGPQIHLGGFQHGAGDGNGNGGVNNGEPFLQFRPAVVYSNAPVAKQYMYPSSSAASSPRYQPPAVVCSYYVGQVVAGGSQRPAHCGPHQNPPGFACYGAPLSRGFPVEEARLAAARDGGAPHNLSLS